MPIALSQSAEPERRAHRLVDLRSLELHRLMADKLRRHPELFPTVIETLTRWRLIVDTRSQGYLAEWEQLIGQGMELCLQVATEDSERAQTLRQCSPFGGILSNKERFAFLKAWADEHAAR